MFTKFVGPIGVSLASSKASSYLALQEEVNLVDDLFQLVCLAEVTLNPKTCVLGSEGHTSDHYTSRINCGYLKAE